MHVPLLLLAPLPLPLAAGMLITPPDASKDAATNRQLVKVHAAAQVGPELQHKNGSRLFHWTPAT
jgi:hypothetical protein